MDVCRMGGICVCGVAEGGRGAEAALTCAMPCTTQAYGVWYTDGEIHLVQPVPGKRTAMLALPASNLLQTLRGDKAAYTSVIADLFGGLIREGYYRGPDGEMLLSQARAVGQGGRWEMATVSATDGYEDQICINQFFLETLGQPLFDEKMKSLEEMRRSIEVIIRF